MLLVVLGSGAHAGIVSFTDPSLFFAASSGFAVTTEDFESTAAGTLLESGDSIGGLTFVSDFSDPLRLAVTDGDEFGGSLPAPTTSGTNFLGTNDADVLLGGDRIALSFSDANAIGLFIISADIPGSGILDGDLLLTAGGASATLDVDDGIGLGGDNFAYFLGLVGTSATFGSAVLTGSFPGAPLFVVDDITLGRASSVPAPASCVLLLSGLLAIAAGRGRGAQVSPSPEPNGQHWRTR
jgi:hypothetical protein